MANSLDRWVGKVAIVTGASAGIGAAIAEALVDAGINVVGLARRKEKIEALANKLAGRKGKLYAVRADVSKEQDIIDAFEWTKNNLGPIHILVNNAATVGMTTLADGDTQLWKNTFDLNVLGLCVATREAVKNMRENNVDGHIIHINSVAGHKVVAGLPTNVYSATKYAVTALAESLRHELNSLDSKIKITSLSPGATKSEYFGHGDHPVIKDLIENLVKLEAEDVANAVVFVLSTPPHVQICKISELTIIPVGEKF